MKKFFVIPLIAALAVFVSCQKQPTEEERKAEVERQVQERLATERLNAEKERLAQQQTEIAQREKELAARDASASTLAQSEQAIPEPTAPAVTERTEPRAETRSTATYGMFYEKLDPYGEWRETNEYGYVWQPREAESSKDWRPYTEGRWVYSDAGWTWVSEESFGWATYHYGRWVRLRRIGWVWVPGEEWAPAWVSWRTNKDYVGWAPLPPEATFDRRSGIQNWADSYYDIGPDQYSFVPSNEIGAEKIRRAVLPAARNITIVVETTNVTRITFSNTTIVNEGPSYDELRSHSLRPIERYRLRRERNLDAQARVRGDELEVSVPVLSDVRNVDRPLRVKERMTDVNVENGWTAVTDRAAAERARTKIRTEATPPPNAPPKKFVKPQEASTTGASATPAASVPAATTRPSPTSPVKATPTPVATAASPKPAAAATARTSASPRVQPSATAMPKPSPTVVSSPAASASVPSATPKAVVPSPTPRAVVPSATPKAAVPSATPRAVVPSPTATVAVASPTISPPTRLQPSPAPSLPPRPLTTPPTVRRTMPPIPVITASPRITVAPAPAQTPREVPKQTVPPHLTPPPAVTTPAPAAPPAAPAASRTVQPSPPAPQDHGRNQQPQRQVPPNRQTGTPTPSPSARPN